MIFDNAKAETAYRTYITTGDKNVAASIHTLSSDLINAIACSLDQPDYHDDMLQEAHLKLQIILNKQKFRPDTRCTLYTFLSVALKNAMIDYLRKTQDTCELHELSATYDLAGEDYAPSLGDTFRNYYQYRFPSLMDCYDIAQYVLDTLVEHLRKTKVLSTLTQLYGLPRARAVCVHNSVELFTIAARLDKINDLEKPLSYANNGKEFTLYPESILLGYPGTLGYKKLLANLVYDQHA